jgi:CBS domain-containing protein
MQYFQTLSLQYPTDNICQQHCQRVAQLMAEMRVNSAVCEASIPIGIVTDTDMSSKIATDRFPINVSV